nr:reverse transcriptase domain-containing protein [Tanacetum cinerariifolium]
GQVKVTNRGLKRILERTVGENRASWIDKLEDALWAFELHSKPPLVVPPTDYPPEIEASNVGYYLGFQDLRIL